MRELNRNSKTTDCDPVLLVDDIEVLLMEFPACPAGTMAFLEDEESILVKIKRGWQYVMVRPILHTCD